MTSDLYVWMWLPGALAPVVCGRLVQEGAVVRFLYGRSYRDRPEAIPLHPLTMPLDGGPFIARRAGELPGPIADAAPDAWGRRVIEYRLHVTGLPALEYLANTNGERIGALHFQSTADAYLPADIEPATLEDLLAAADAVEHDRPLPPDLDAALQHGTSIGGARPKATLSDHGRFLIAKFASSTDPWNIVRAEWACMRLARRCGVVTPATEVVTVNGRDVLLVERFDRAPAIGNAPPARRLMLSALSLLDLDDTEARLASYPDLAELLRRLARDGKADAEQLFRRMVFNILMGNTDDHARNHAAFWDGHWLELTRAYDLVPTRRIGQEADQAMIVGADGRRSTLANALGQAGRFGLTRKHASALVDEIEEILRENWREEFLWSGVPEMQIDRLHGTTVLSPVAVSR